MKTPIAILLVIALLALGGAALAEGGSPQPGQVMSVQPGMTAGGIYHLTSLAWQVSGSVAGEDYVLDAPYRPDLRGNGCCCTYLPCIIRNQ